MKIRNVKTFEKDHEYRWATVSSKDNWADIKISRQSQKFDGTQDFTNRFADHIVYDCEDKSTERVIESLIKEIRLLALHHDHINTQIHPNIHIDDTPYTLYWVYAEDCSHIRRIGMKAGRALPKNMYVGNCFYTQKDAEEFRSELIAIFNKYGITITRI